MARGEGAAGDAHDRLRLIRTANVGPVTYVELLRRFGSARAALEAIPDLAARGGGRAPRLATSASVGSSRVDLQACKLEYSIVSPK